MFSASPPALLPLSSGQIDLVSHSAETTASHHYEANVHRTNGQPPAPARAELTKFDSRMRIFIENAAYNLPARPMTPRLQDKARWLNTSRNAQAQMHFLSDWQSVRGVSLVSEEELSETIATEQIRGHFVQCELDSEVACGLGAPSTGSLGAGNSIIAFLLGSGTFGMPILASIHKSISAGESYSPDMAYEKIILPLEMKTLELSGHVLKNKRFFFVGGNSDSLQACTALAFTAEQHKLNVPVSMLGINDDSTYVNAMLRAPTPVAPNGAFFVARVSEESDAGE